MVNLTVPRRLFPVTFAKRLPSDGGDFRSMVRQMFDETLPGDFLQPVSWLPCAGSVETGQSASMAKPLIHG
jgi:hypothetical protein